MKQLLLILMMICLAGLLWVGQAGAHVVTNCGEVVAVTASPVVVQTALLVEPRFTPIATLARFIRPKYVLELPSKNIAVLEVTAVENYRRCATITTILQLDKANLIRKREAKNRATLVRACTQAGIPPGGLQRSSR